LAKDLGDASWGVEEDWDRRTVRTLRASGRAMARLAHRIGRHWDEAT
jgi:hypothetical protein